MRFAEYFSAAEFSAAVLPALKRYEIQNNLLFVNLCDGPGKIMAAVWSDAGELLLTAIRTEPFPLLMFETDNIHNYDAVGFLAHEFTARGIVIDAFNTEPSLAACFADTYGKAAGKQFRHDQSLILYVIDRIPDLTNAVGYFRQACERDMYFLPYWCADFVPACNLGAFNLEVSTEKLKKQLAAGHTYLWEDDVPVSTAAWVREVTDCKIIGQVYTPPLFRGHGYAGACVGSLTRMLLESGDAHVALYADAANPISNAVYRKLGYREIFRYDQYCEV